MHHASNLRHCSGSLLLPNGQDTTPQPVNSQSRLHILAYGPAGKHAHGELRHPAAGCVYLQAAGCSY